MSELVIDWAQSNEAQLTLYEENNRICLQRHTQALLISAQLTESAPGNSQLQTWMGLGGHSLNHFQGALAMAPESGALWLLQILPPTCGTEQLLASLESLLNQRDIWRTLAARLSRPAQRFKPRPLGQLLY
ncbi:MULTISPECIES: hypothetical protein [Pseudomonas]|uniref:Type III secretion protein n=2 Tax=Pseudomonas TaxID=286 RepID=A0A0W0I5V7_PSEFL|nr:MULTISPECIES: hypothetical protein [Pseudomonas]KTB68472.1 hypothetical protein AO063_08330 [Pseudomonas fluorescens ICMP 11288]RMQ91453.1 hypothetical protein ALP97_04305 [Pseudomonas salomonii]